MAMHFFSIPAINGVQVQEAFNRFCAGQAVVAVEHHLVEAGAATFWAIAVTVRDGVAAMGGKAPRSSTKVDYKEVLSAPDFAVFSALRELRKSVAQAEGVAVYTVFTNEQLAAMVTGKVTSIGGLRAIDGIGEARAEKYGARFVERLRASLQPSGAAA